MHIYLLQIRTLPFLSHYVCYSSRTHVGLALDLFLEFQEPQPLNFPRLNSTWGDVPWWPVIRKMGKQSSGYCSSVILLLLWEILCLKFKTMK